MKRRRTESLTGGSGDTNPQWFSTSATQSAADTTTTTSVSTPPGIGLSVSGRALAMEILKVMIEFETSTGVPALPGSASFAPGATTAASIFMNAYLSSKNFGTTRPTLGMGDATVFAFARQQYLIYESSAVATAFTQSTGPIVIDLTDGAGHGVLYANQNMFIQVASSSVLSAVTARVKILYREKFITQEELLGLVLQSNQN